MRTLLRFGLLMCLLSGAVQASGGFTVRLSFTKSISLRPVTGRVFLFFSRDLAADLTVPRISRPMPSFALDVRGWRPGETLVLTRRNATAWMGDLDTLSGRYAVQAFLRTNGWERRLTAEGNGHSEKIEVCIAEKGPKAPLCLRIDSVFPGRGKFRETEFLQEIAIESRLLSTFTGSRVIIRGAVVLPQSYHRELGRRYPLVIVFPAWNSTHAELDRDDFQLKRFGMGTFGPGTEKVFVYLDHDCANGYHEFCDSPNNGPRERAFFEEVLPFLESKFRVCPGPETRFLMGHSSGAWAALWLLLNHPDALGGVFVSAPDPVDFTSFLGENIYDGETNLFRTRDGKEKLFCGALTRRDLAGLDRLMGCGEQLYSFDAAFSPRSKSGSPRHLFDWESGRVNPDVAMSWARYDLSRLVAGLAAERKKALCGKIHIYVARDDEIGLDVPVALFQKALTMAGVKAEIVIMEKGGHSGLWTDDLRAHVHKLMDALLDTCRVR